MNRLKKIGLVIVGLLILFLLINFNLLTYGIAQLKGQLHIISQAVSINEALVSSNYTDSQKEKLRLVKEIREFAIDSLGLNESKSYRTIYNQQNADILWTITACPPYELKAYEWTFPFLGSVPYKGFFNYNTGKIEADELKNQGFDVDYSAVSGWSTLGWFGDPLLSNMLKRSEGSLAELIIHELTHATVYLKNKADYNENLATFIGIKGAEIFLTKKFGAESSQYKNYVMYQRDKKKYVKHILSGTEKLDSLYGSMIIINDSITKNELKNNLVQEIIKTLDTLMLEKPNRYKWDMIKRELPNNTYFMSYVRYRKRQSDFELVLNERFSGNLVAFLNEVKQYE